MKRINVGTLLKLKGIKQHVLVTNIEIQNTRFLLDITFYGVKSGNDTRVFSFKVEDIEYTLMKRVDRDTL